MKPIQIVVDPEVEVPEAATSVEDTWEILKVRKENLERCKKITGRNNVEAVLIKCCAKHFNQAAETPLAQGVWEEKLDIMDDNNKIEEILRGEYRGLGLDVQECTDWIEGMKRVE